MQLPTLPRSISETPFAFVDVEGDQKENDASTKNKPCKLDDITSLLRGSALFLTFRNKSWPNVNKGRWSFANGGGQMPLCRPPLPVSAISLPCTSVSSHSKQQACLQLRRQVRMRGVLAILHYQAIFGSECCHGRVYYLYTRHCIKLLKILLPLA